MEWSKEVMARNIRRYMEASGKNQKELAQIVGVSAPTVNEWLKAKKYPRIDKIEIMANFFGCEKSDLIEDKVDRSASQKRAETVSHVFDKLLRNPVHLEAAKRLIEMEPEKVESLLQMIDMFEKK